MRPERAMTAALIAAQEDERARLARELHDGVVQEIIALIQRVDRMERHLERGEARQALGCAQSVRQGLVGLTEELRAVIADLRPPALQEFGLIHAVALLVRRPGHELPTVTLRVEGAERRLEPDHELAAYRIVQEGWSNILRHARARSAVLTLHYARDRLVVSLRDDGVGFVPGRARPDQADHCGLRGMRERAESAGGTLQLRSAPGGGTTLTASLPAPAVAERRPAARPLAASRRNGRAARPIGQPA